MNGKQKILSLLICLITVALCAAVSLIFPKIAVVAVIVAAASPGIMWFLDIKKRKSAVAKLSEELDRLLSESETLSFSAYEEGELYVLRSEIGKLTARLFEQAKALNADKIFLSDSIADISHQLRTPLTSMELNISILASSASDEASRQRALRDLHKLLDKTEWLISALLAISKLDAGTVQFKTEPVSLIALCKKASEPFGVSMELKEQKLRFEGDEKASFELDFQWTSEAISNLIKNAVEHTSAGGTVTISVKENAVFSEITVADNGEGFCEDDIPHLFERFYRGKNAGENSVGIGLALTRMIVSRQNGTVKASNIKPKGALFTVRFYKSVV